jgi:hypothetical protein
MLFHEANSILLGATSHINCHEFQTVLMRNASEIDK